MGVFADALTALDALEGDEREARISELDEKFTAESEKAAKADELEKSVADVTAERDSARGERDKLRKRFADAYFSQEKPKAEPDKKPEPHGLKEFMKFDERTE